MISMHKATPLLIDQRPLGFDTVVKYVYDLYAKLVYKFMFIFVILKLVANIRQLLPTDRIN